MASGERMAGASRVLIWQGTGVAPLVFADNVPFPFRVGFAQVYGLFSQAGPADPVAWIGQGKVGLPANAMVASAWV